MAKISLNNESGLFQGTPEDIAFIDAHYSDMTLQDMREMVWDVARGDEEAVPEQLANATRFELLIMLADFDYANYIRECLQHRP